MTTPNPTSARRSLRAAGRDPEHQRRQDNFAHARRRCLQKEQQQQQSCDLTMVDPVLDGSTAPPATGRLRNNRRKNDPMVNTAPPAVGRPRDHRRENSPRAAARVNSGRGAIAACAPPTAAEAPAAVCALADLPAPERLPASERPEIETPRAAAREMTALREEVAALRVALTAHTSASTQVIAGLRLHMAWEVHFRSQSSQVPPPVTPEDKRRAVAQRAAEIAERRAVFDASNNSLKTEEAR